MAVQEDVPAPLGQVRRATSDFLANLSHEIRTPLSGILGMVDLLLETPLGEDQKEYATAARTCAEDLLGQLNSALEFSELSAGSLVLDESDFNLAETLEAAARRHARKAREKGLEVAVTLDPRLPAAAVGDAVRLSEAVSLLVANAIRRGLAGSVELKASAGPAASGTLRLEVTVHHRGPREDGPHLARRHAEEGLGLALTQRLVTLMGGEFTPENESGECNPSSFWVPLRTSGGTAAPPPPPAAGMACRVLVVEDDLIAQRIVSHHLSRFGYDARVVSSGEEAVNEVVLRRYDVVLMDLQMPSMDGFETARRIREQPGCGEVPVIALTARADGMSRLTCLHQGMQAFLEKPLEAGKLAETIQRVLTKA